MSDAPLPSPSALAPAPPAVKRSTGPSVAVTASAFAGGAGPGPTNPAVDVAGLGLSDRLAACASVWSSPGSHGVLGEEEEADAGDSGADHLPPDDDDDDLVAAWGAAAEAAVARLASPTTAPAALAALAADPHAAGDIIESPAAWAGLLGAVPGLLGDPFTAGGAAALVATVAASAAVEAPALLSDLAAAAVAGLGVRDHPPAAAVACALELLSTSLPRAWAPFSPPALATAARAAAAAVARRSDRRPSPSLAALAAAPAWLRRWAATPRVASHLWEEVGADQLGLHVRAVEAADAGDAGLAGSVALVAAALATAGGRAGLADTRDAATVALARLCVAGELGTVAVTAGCVGLAALAEAGRPFPPAALAALVAESAPPAAVRTVLTALGRTPPGVDALLRAVGGYEDDASTPWPKKAANPLPPAVAAAVAGDALGELHLSNPLHAPSRGALAAAVASRTAPGLVALTAAGADPASLAEGWITGDAAASWAPPPPPAAASPAAWAVCAAAAGLAALHAPAVAAAVHAAVAGWPPCFDAPAAPPRPAAEEVEALYAAHGAALAALLE